MSLLSEAKKHKVQTVAKFHISAEHIELAGAWARGEVRLAQVTKVLKLPASNGSQVYTFLARALREYIQGLK